eukprot:TRINITY_DN111199_c0_g1_i1.p1 TRINITY_DN111199_c0_g1~~TRINITY_DN111199_c0_g1_i1.p1  ORF type:complete len:740 (+),score=186.12 TRINITY_DN111199_c0_g1_i1:186-2405(+)
MGSAVGTKRRLNEAESQVKQLTAAVEAAQQEASQLREQLSKCQGGSSSSTAPPSPPSDSAGEKPPAARFGSTGQLSEDGLVTAFVAPDEPSELQVEAAGDEASKKLGDDSFISPRSPEAEAMLETASVRSPQARGVASVALPGAVDCASEQSAEPQKKQQAAAVACEDDLPPMPSESEDLMDDEFEEEVTAAKPALQASVGISGSTGASGSTSKDAKSKTEMSGKLSSSLDSEASTHAPGQQALTTCAECHLEASEMFLDTSDMRKYCERCWCDYYGEAPSRLSLNADDERILVPVEVSECWLEGTLREIWAANGLIGWPPQQVRSSAPEEESEEVWSNVCIRVRKDVVGAHSREQYHNRALCGSVLRNRYRIDQCCGEGHFTKAYAAMDLEEDKKVCVKRHRGLAVEALADLMVLRRRLDEVDPGHINFPRLHDAFFDIVGFTVEELIKGKNCLAKEAETPGFFADVKNLRHVARGALQGLSLLQDAGIVHNDMKPDNIMWVQAPVTGDSAASSSSAPMPSVRIVDFGCARLDASIEERGRNWSLAEGGAGHLGKWSPEMVLRLPITHKNDVWGLAIALCELYCGRVVWRGEQDTAEVVLAQAIGLCGLTEGLPSSLLRRSPLDVRQLYTPAGMPVQGHLPLRRNALGQLEALRPMRYGLEQVLGDGWRQDLQDQVDFGDLLEAALVVDPKYRPSAKDLLELYSFAASSLPAPEVDLLLKASDGLSHTDKAEPCEDST